jgi:hypothetical protein
VREVGRPQRAPRRAHQRRRGRPRAGTYVFSCFIPSPDGTPHVAKGMGAPFTVVAEPRAPPPASPSAGGPAPLVTAPPT